MSYGSSYLSDDERRRTYAIDKATELVAMDSGRNFWATVNSIYDYLKQSEPMKF